MTSRLRDFTIRALLLAASPLVPTALLAQPAVDHSQHGNPTPAPVDHSQHAAPAAPVDHSRHGIPSPAPAALAPAPAPVDHSQHTTAPAAVDHSQHTAPADAAAVDHLQHMAGSGMAPADARDPHAYSGGYLLGQGLHSTAQGHQHLHVANAHPYHAVIVDQLEASEDSARTWDMQGWVRQGFHRVSLTTEGEAERSRVTEAHTELMWGRALTPYWDTRLGIRHDTGDAADQGWLAAGVQGLAPYWFEIDATAYLGSAGQTALQMEAEYELLLTQRLILQPSVELTLHGRNDTRRQIGSGLSEAIAGLRLRYEFSRQLAPYIGVEWKSHFGNTADLARLAGEHRKDTRWVAGVRFWFQ